jgi:spermidine synthase
MVDLGQIRNFFPCSPTSNMIGIAKNILVGVRVVARMVRHMRRWTAGVVALISGCTGLSFQVLWYREAGFLFGADAESAAVTVAAFFGGLALGSYSAAERVHKSPRPALHFAAIEAAGVILAVVALQLAFVYHEVFVFLFSTVSSGGLHDLLRLLLAFLFFLPASFFMGASFPYLVRWGGLDQQKGWGGISALFYSLNIIGGATGALAAGFLFPERLGYDRTGLLAALVGSTSPILVLIADRFQARRARPGATPHSNRPASKPGTDDSEIDFSRRTIMVLAAGSGFLALSAEILFHRMLAGILQNSVYTFSTVVSLYLILLAIGAVVAYGLIRRGISLETGLAPILYLTALALLLSPYLFHWIVGLDPVKAGSWSGYLAKVVGVSLLVVSLPVLGIGIVFPFLFRSLANHGQPVEWLSRILFTNLLGGAVGALFAAFMLLPLAGVRGGLGLLSALYLCLLLFALYFRGKPEGTPLNRMLATASVILLVLQVGFLRPDDLPAAKVDPEKGEAVIAQYEGASGTTVVVQQGLNRRIKVNNTYTLGDISAARLEMRQADIPLLVRPGARRLFFIGMGTGITAGSSLNFPVEEVVVSELIPEVVRAAREWFGSANNGLFTDGRARVIPEDGRLFLSSYPGYFDLIVCDLILPWRAGAGSLYSRENFEIVKRALGEDGVFFLWLPMYQLSEPEFRIILNTFLEVFDNSVVFRADHSPNRPAIALAASKDPDWSLLPGSMISGAKKHPTFSKLSGDELISLILLYYSGNLKDYRSTDFENRIHTDDHPLVEFLAAKSLQERRAGREAGMRGANYVAFLKALRSHSPTNEDPFLSRVSISLLPAVDAGQSYVEAIYHRDGGDQEKAREALKRFMDELPREASGIMLDRDSR